MNHYANNYSQSSMRPSSFSQSMCFSLYFNNQWFCTH